VTETAPGIAQLDSLVAALPAEERARFDRIFEVSITTGRTVPPKTMHAWLAEHFGSVEAVREQRIVRVTNHVGAMEIFAHSVVATDPFRLARALAAAQEERR
jgi:hypothetical protein